MSSSQPLGRLVAGLAAATIAASGLAACGSGDADGKTTLRMLMHVNAPTNKAIEALNQAFEAKYPDVKVEVTLVPTPNMTNARNTRLAAENIDIVEVEAFLGGTNPSYVTGVPPNVWGQEIQAGNYVDLTGEPFIDNFLPNAISNTSTIDGKVWSVPQGSNMYTGVFYNKKIFAQHGLSEPKTWSEFVQVCETLKANGVTPLTIGQKDGWPAGLPNMAIIQSLHSDLPALDEALWTGKVKFTDPKLVEVLEKTKTIFQYTEQGFGGIDYTTIPARFAAGKAAMLPDGTWEAPAIDAAKPDFEYGYFPLPGSDNAADNATLGGKYDSGMAIAASSSNRDIALKWLEFYSDPTNYAQFIKTSGFIPAQPNVKATPFLDSLAPYVETMRLGWGSVFHAKPTAGKYAKFYYQGIKPIGEFSDMKQLAEHQQKDWDAG